MEDWINYHKNIFDFAVLINHHSTDRSVEIASCVMPSHWKIINSRLPEFDAIQNDWEVMDVEREYLPKESWKMALNLTEYIFTPNLASRLAEWGEEYPESLAFGSRAVCLVDREDDPELQRPAFKGRNHGFIDYARGVDGYRRWRFIHKAEHGNYHTGRHGVKMEHTCLPEFLHIHLTYSPWPLCKDRKLQIQTRMPQSDKELGRGYQHLVDEEGLEIKRNEFLAQSYDLFEDELYSRYYKEIVG